MGGNQTSFQITSSHANPTLWLPELVLWVFLFIKHLLNGNSRELRRKKVSRGQTGMKSRKKKLSGPSLSRALLLTLTLSASWLRVFTNYSGTQRGAKTRRSGIHLHSYWFVLLLLSFFFLQEQRWNFKGAKKKQSRNRSSNRIPEWASHRDPYGCRAVVMSLSAHLLWLPSCL